MCGFVVASGRYDPQVIRRAPGWAWRCLCRTTLADFSCFAGELKKTGTGLCVSPPLLYMSRPRTTIGSSAGLTPLHVGHPQLSGSALFTHTRLGGARHPFKIVQRVPR